MRKALIILAILAQLVVLAAMAGKRELVLAFGERIYLRTAPIDPRDPFRGDFVRLRYALNNVNLAQQRLSAERSSIGKGERVYAVLRPLPDQVYELDYLSDQPPRDGLFLAGRTVQDWRLARPGHLAVKYGIEQLFVQQGRGLSIEQRQGRRGEVQVPMEVEVAVGRDGTAVLSGYRWSRLGIRLQVLRAPQAPRNADNLDPLTPLSAQLLVSLHNISDEDLLLADPGAHCGFGLQSVGLTPVVVTSASDACADTAAQAADLRRLAPGDTYSVTIDLTEPRWHVRVNGDPDAQEIGRLAPQEQFRLVYRSPGGIDDPALWRGELPSQAFNAAGQLD